MGESRWWSERRNYIYVFFFLNCVVMFCIVLVSDVVVNIVIFFLFVSVLLVIVKESVVLVNKFNYLWVIGNFLM